ncbi:MAG: histidine phosphatase family protein [Nitrospirae bacterium]|nr:histidine phosphatase family protein [Nitrospirota bacterium]
MVTTLYLIRHGETEGSETKRYKGSIDIPLSEKGIEQVKKTSGFLIHSLRDSASSKQPDNDKGLLTAVYCSDLNRSLKSAGIIAGPHGLTPLVVPDLRERSFGIWEGMSFTEIKEKYPAEFEAWAGNPLKYSPIEGESTIEVSERVINALDAILSNHNGERIAIVAHGGVNRIILCHIIGIPLENIFRIEQDFAAVNIIEFWEKYPVVKALNLTIQNSNKPC